jgi:23S rRNA-/tRNA-specific pseudouridylate synthase
MDAASKSKGKAAGMINGWIGSCCLLDDKDQGAMMAWGILQAFEENQLGLTPDVVTYCLVYSALTRTNQEKYHVLANIALEHAERWSKKEGGSKKRRALAASKRNMANPQDADLTPFGIQILQDTPHFMVVSKPSGMVCFHKKTTTAGKVTKSRVKRQKEGDVDNTRMDYSLQDVLLTANIPLSTLNPECRGLVHRIDRGTSGCIVLAKTNDMHAKIVTEFFLRRAKKSYQAVVVAAKDMPDRGEISLSVGGRPASSKFVVEDRINSIYARLRVETLTGRKHQVRVHCAQGLQTPILLDALYGDESLVYPEPIAEFSQSGQRFFLHASSLEIASFGIDCKAPVPTWWEEAITLLGRSE